ncbi:MAG TPA: methyltransferase domain-containing protein [Polyangiaceae bacterium]|nr:methyltransferase domain-containing protein [Polyangiaceae bacterium]
MNGLIQSLDAFRADGTIARYKQQSYELVPVNVGQILDVGCGTGDDVLALAERCGPGTLVVGLERRLELVDEATRRARNVALHVHFAVGDAHSLPFTADCFDVVRADRLLSDVDDRARVLKELLRVTRPGGRLLLHDHEAVLTNDGVRIAGLSSLEPVGSWPWYAGEDKRAQERGVSLLGLKALRSSDGQA